MLGIIFPRPIHIFPGTQTQTRNTIPPEQNANISGQPPSPKRRDGRGGQANAQHHSAPKTVRWVCLSRAVPSDDAKRGQRCDSANAEPKPNDCVAQLWAETLLCTWRGGAPRGAIFPPHPVRCRVRSSLLITSEDVMTTMGVRHTEFNQQVKTWRDLNTRALLSDICKIRSGKSSFSTADFVL